MKLLTILFSLLLLNTGFSQEIPAGKAARQKRHIVNLLNELGIEFIYGDDDFLVGNYDEFDIVILADVWEDALQGSMLVINTDSYVGEDFDFIDMYVVGTIKSISPGQVEAFKTISIENQDRFVKLYTDGYYRPAYVYRSPISSYTALTADDLKFLANNLGLVCANFSVAD